MRMDAHPRRVRERWAGVRATLGLHTFGIRWIPDSHTRWEMDLG